MRKIFAIFVYTFIILMIGRNLSYLPKFTLFSNKSQETDSQTKQLKDLIQKDFANLPGNYSYYFVNLNTNQALGSGERETFTAASLNKIPIIAALYYLNSKNKLDLDEKVTIQKDDIQDYGTGSLRYKEPGGVYSLKTLAKLALKESDNTAAHVLSNMIGEDDLQLIVEDFGMNQTNMANNKTTTYDMYILFDKIFNNKITTPAKTQELLNFMQDTDIEDRISKDLPSNSIVFHKSGDAQGSVHDVGIVTNGNQKFFLGVMTSDVSGHEKDVAKIMSLVAKDIDAFLNKEH